MKRGIFSILAVLTVFAIMTLGCQVDPDDTPEQKGTDVTLVSVLADGVKDTSTTTELYLSFSKPITDLTKDDITLTGADNLIGGPLAKDEKNELLYTLKINGVTAEGSLNVTVVKEGYSISGSSKQVFIHYKATSQGDIEVELSKVEVNGSDTENTTQLTLTFNKAINGLNADDITLTSDTTGATKGTLGTAIGTGPVTYTLPISVTAGGNLTVTVTKSGYNIIGSGKIVPINFMTNVEFSSVTANGSSGFNGSPASTTTELLLYFNSNSPIIGLTEDNIELDGVPGVIKGRLTNIIAGTTVYTLPISGFTEGGTLSVTVTNPTGYTITGSPKTVTIYFRIIDVAFEDVTADGDAATTTTELTLTFSEAIDGLTENDIILEGVGNVTKGTLTAGAAAGTYTLPISGFNSIKEDGSGELAVTVGKIVGYNIINDPPKTVEIYLVEIPVKFIKVEANGTANTVTTTELTLTFDKAIPGLTNENIKLTGANNVTKGDLTGSNPYTLPISGFTADDTLTVEVEKFGYGITTSDNEPIEVEIFYYEAPAEVKNVIKVEGTGADAKLIHIYPGAPNLTVRSTSPYGGTAAINDDGTITISGGTGNEGGALLYKFPTSTTDATFDYQSYDMITVDYVLVDKEQGNGGTGNCEIALRTWGTRDSYGYGAPEYPDLMKDSNNPLIFPVRGAGTTDGFAWEHNSYQWAANNRYETYVIEITRITFSKVPHYTVTFDVNYDGGPTFEAREYLENDPISILGDLPAPTRTGYIFNGWFVTGQTTAVAETTKVTADMVLVGKWTEGSLSPLVINNPKFN